MPVPDDHPTSDQLARAVTAAVTALPRPLRLILLCEIAAALVQDAGYEAALLGETRVLSRIVELAAMLERDLGTLTSAANRARAERAPRPDGGADA